MSKAAQTEALYTALEQAIGEEPAETLMQLLSRDDDTPTRTDLALLRSDLADEFAKVDAKFETIEARFESIEAKFETVDDRFQKIDDRFQKIDNRFDDLNATFHSYARLFIVVHTTTVLAIAGMVLGVTQLM